MIPTASSTSTTAAKPTEDEKKAERLAKLEAWKQKQAADRERKMKEGGTGVSTRDLLKEIDQKAAAAPAVASSQSPTTPSGVNSPAPYAGKFDPKVIAKKATAAIENLTALGQDVALPKSTKESANLTSSVTSLQADKPKAPAIPSLPTSKRSE